MNTNQATPKTTAPSTSVPNPPLLVSQSRWKELKAVAAASENPEGFWKDVLYALVRSCNEGLLKIAFKDLSGDVPLCVHFPQELRGPYSVISIPKTLPSDAVLKDTLKGRTMMAIRTDTNTTVWIRVVDCRVNRERRGLHITKWAIVEKSVV